MSFTTDPNDPRLGHGGDETTVPQNEVYLVLSDEERAKGFIRPVRYTYVHVGQKPKSTLRQLTAEEKARYPEYVMFEPNPDPESPITGRYWSQKQIDDHGCGEETKMGKDLAETYARDPKFYGATYCVHCKKHLPVQDFKWLDGEVVGS